MHYIPSASGCLSSPSPVRSRPLRMPPCLTPVLPPESAALPASDTATDPELHRLEREAFALARADGCSGVGQCRAAPVGQPSCGGHATTSRIAP